MKLIVQELKASPLTQVVIPSENTIIQAIRPHILRYNNPTGSLQLQLIDDTSTVIAISNPVPISSIETMNYFHGYVEFDINAYVQKGRQYTVSLSGLSGYSFSESSYCGWCNGFDLAKYPINSVPSNAFKYPLDLEIWERTEK